MQTFGTWLQLIGTGITATVLVYVIATSSQRINAVRQAVVGQLTQLANAIASLGTTPPTTHQATAHLTAHAELSADVTLKRSGTGDERITRLENDYNALLNQLTERESRLRAEINQAKVSVLQEFQSLSGAIRVREAYVAVFGLIVSIAGYICQLIG
jgi:hypothetical protein